MSNPAQFTKKPVTITAVQFTEAVRDAYLFDKVPLPAGVEISSTHLHPPSRKVYSARAYIQTLEGRMEVSIGDWVITGVKGEHYPCKPDIFEATYSPAVAPTEAAAMAATVPASLSDLFCQAMAWGAVYHPVVDTAQWDRLRDDMAANFVKLAAQAPVAGQPAPRTYTDGTRTLQQDVLSAIRDYARSRPEDGESWESWFEAAFDLCQSRVVAVFREHGQPAEPSPAYWAVIAKSGEGVLFTEHADAQWTLTGRGAGSDGFGVPTIGEAFRDAYDDEQDEFKLVRVQIFPAAAPKGDSNG